MCQMWLRIRAGSLWNPKMKLNLALKTFDLKDVNLIRISLDPFYADNSSIRDFWYNLSLPEITKKNSKFNLETEIRNDGKPPSLLISVGNKKILFQTVGMTVTDIIMLINNLLKNLELINTKN